MNGRGSHPVDPDVVVCLFFFAFQMARYAEFSRRSIHVLDERCFSPVVSLAFSPTDQFFVPLKVFRLWGAARLHPVFLYGGGDCG